MPYKFVFLSLSLFGVLTYIDSSVSYSGAVSLYKQLLLVIVLISFLSTIKNRRTDPLMLLGITFFVFSLTIFTLFQLNDISDLFVLSGYITALLIFYFSSKSDFNIGFYIKKSLVFLGFIHCLMKKSIYQQMKFLMVLKVQLFLSYWDIFFFGELLIIF